MSWQPENGSAAPTSEKKKNIMQKLNILAFVRSAVIAASVAGILLNKQVSLAAEGLVVVSAVAAILSSALFMSKDEIKSSLKVLFIVLAVAGAVMTWGATHF